MCFTDTLPAKSPSIKYGVTWENPAFGGIQATGSGHSLDFLSAKKLLFSLSAQDNQ